MLTVVRDILDSLGLRDIRARLSLHGSECRFRDSVVKSGSFDTGEVVESIDSGDRDGRSLYDSGDRDGSSGGGGGHWDSDNGDVGGHTDFGVWIPSGLDLPFFFLGIAIRIDMRGEV